MVKVQKKNMYRNDFTIFVCKVIISTNFTNYLAIKIPFTLTKWFSKAKVVIKTTVIVNY